MKQGIIFDMDGTLWDSADGVAKSWTQVIQNEYKKDGSYRAGYQAGDGQNNGRDRRYFFPGAYFGGTEISGWKMR